MKFAYAQSPYRRAARGRSTGLLALATVFSALALAPRAPAQICYWSGGDHDFWSRDNWTDDQGNYTSPNWDSTTELNFGVPIGSSSNHDNNGYVTNDIGYKTQFYSMFFDSQPFVLNGDSLLVRNSTIQVSDACSSVSIATDINVDPSLFSNVEAQLTLDVADSSTLTISGGIYGTGALYVGQEGLTQDVNGTVILSGFHNFTEGTNVLEGHLIDDGPHGSYYFESTLEFHLATDWNYTSPLTGTGNFIKSGAGTLTLGGNDVHTGSTTVNGGTLVVASPASTASFEFNGGNLDIQLASNVTYGGRIVGTGIFTKSGPSTLTLTNANNYMTGGVFVTGGELIETTPHVANITLSNSSYLDFDMNYDDDFWQGTISGSGSFTKDGSGTLFLLNANTYTGPTYVYGGTLIDSAPHGTGYLDDAALEFAIATDQTYAGPIVGLGSFTKGGAGTLTLSNAYTGTYRTAYTGGTTVTGGRLIETSPHGNYVTNADLEFNIAGDLVFRDPTTLQPDSISGTGSFTKSGAGTLILYTPTTYEGNTAINAGAIAAGVINALPTTTDLTVNAGGQFIAGRDISQTVDSLSGSGAVELGGVFTVDGTDTTTFSGVISGGGSFTQSGDGTLTLSGVNTYTGGTTVSGGKLIDFNPHGTYDLQNNAALVFSDSKDVSFSTPITGVGSFTKSGSGTFKTDGESTYLGATTISAGTFSNGVDDALPTTTDLTVDSGAKYDLNVYNQTIASLTGDGSVTTEGKVLTVDEVSGDATFAGLISGTGSLVKDGAGVLTLTGVDSYRGGTTVNGGELLVDDATGNYVTNATLEFDNTANATYNGLISGTGSFEKDGAGTLSFTGANTYTGGTTVLAGTLIDANPHGTYDLKSTLIFDPATDISFAGSAINGFGTFQKAGAGTLTLTSAITQNIAVQLQSGTLKGSANVFRDVSSTGGTLQFDQSQDALFGSTYSGAGSLLKTGVGAVAIEKAQTYTGGTTIEGGSLQFRAPGSLAGGVTVDTGTDLTNSSGGRLTVAGRTYNQGVIDTAKGSTTDFTGLVSGAGEFADSGKVEFDGGFSPGNSPASVTLQGDMTLGSTNQLTMELGGTALGTGYDHLNVLGNTSLGGTLDVVEIGGFAASLGESFDLFDFTSETGSFSSVYLPTLAKGFTWNASALYTSGTLTVGPLATPEPAPFAVLGLGALALLCRRRTA